MLAAAYGLETLYHPSNTCTPLDVGTIVVFNVDHHLPTGAVPAQVVILDF